MQTASSDPRPYLINRAGGINRVKEFSLINGRLSVVPEGEKPLAGVYHLVYRCADHAFNDIKRTVSSDGTNWAVLDPLPDDGNDICYPFPHH